MLKRWLAKWSKRLIDALTCFLHNPLRAVAAAGLGFGILFVILTAILTATMFVKTAPLAGTVAPLLHNVILGVLALIGIIALTFLGYRNVSASFAGATVTVSAEDVEDARGNALDALEKISDAVDPEKP
ncbi:MAG: hypothetical protein K5831_06290 [Brevundimonas sp.]|uniref:hypothetical protein n=1 Tax=Brevundimonas sp. TaxID=1871086 RepID=UPI00258391C8|nr:hypothetical protein [Brevundimonas sp.]MCV0414475.1 hypothetical protein [Brevundimonas sp.]